VLAGKLRKRSSNGRHLAGKAKIARSLPAAASGYVGG